ncbi:DNA-binding LacI/PurR family transcriptional regulator [Lipingzhangella halophila]|uniref:DNA-binding LacI/PurR family transcriptional regulator n=1 Tax=Lipingzhangella halophila TaxID=1783352 RepID=A0A7W7RMW2_9ACTN|nr:LacI family DNA-binding transcriptional regulator [Lipingzhangella halophila]MBB4934523.1 DNA-binding LacI/PurR family transcriptional regulator [Lipingzhangella halophila]
MDGGQRPTLEMVAERAGVGRGTVSRVINDSASVAEQTRQAVLRAVAELGYVPNHSARTLVTRRTDTVALVVTEPHERIFAEPFFAQIIKGVSAALNERGLQLMLTMVGSGVQHERASQYLTEDHVDGVLIVSEHRDDPLPKRLAESGLPLVHGGRPLGREQERLSFVEIDNVGGGQMATRHLLQSGRRAIGTVTGPRDMAAGVERLRGYEQALRDAGHEVLPERIATADFSFEGGTRAMRELLHTAPDLDAVFVASDVMAVAALRVLRESGRTVPGDVALVGYDDITLALHADPPLTTVHQPAERMGWEMARLLANQITWPTETLPGTERREPETVLLDTHLVIRESG